MVKSIGHQLFRCSIAVNSAGRGVWTFAKEGPLVIAEMSKDTACRYVY